MPELPEVETTISGLKSKVLFRTFDDVWSDWEKIVKKPKNFNLFKKEIKGKKIKKVWRRAKNIIFDLSGGYSLLMHQKMTGHLLIGNWKEPYGESACGRQMEIGNWEPLKRGALEDPVNRYIHLMFWLSGDLMLALSDLRKFAKVELWKTEELLNSADFKKLGLEPLEKDFTFKKFKDILKNKKARLRSHGASARRGKIKQVLMDQNVIAGIGNIYSSEALWEAKIHPEKDVSKLSAEELKKLYEAIKKVLTLGIKLGGESFSDYRKVDGSKGDFDTERKAYQRENQKCQRCDTLIERLKFGGRSAFFCPVCQKK